MATCANWLFNILFSQVSNLAIENTAWKFYTLFICLNAIDFVLIAFFFPETKGEAPASVVSCASRLMSSICRQVVGRDGQRVRGRGRPSRRTRIGYAGGKGGRRARVTDRSCPSSILSG